MRAAGMTDQEVKEAEELARATSAKYKSISTTEIMHSARNIRSVVGTFEEATKIIDPLMKLRVVAQGAHPEKAEELGEDFDKLIKGMEIKGVTQDHAKFEHYIDNMAKAVNVFGDTLRPTDFYEMFKYGRAATNALGDEFMLKTAPTLAQELGGSSAGKALSSFHTQFVGGKMSNKAVDMLNKYGLVDQSKVIRTTTGAVKGVLPGGIIGGEYLKPGQEDPYAWTNKVLLPHLAQKGVTDPAEIQEAISAMASQQTTAQMMSIFATQQKRIEKDWDLIQKAHGISAADEYLKSDPKVAQEAVKKQFDNYMGETAKPFVGPATTSMNWLASGLNYMSDYARQNPGHHAAATAWGTAMGGALSADTAQSMFGKIFGKGGGSFLLSKVVATMAPMLAIAQLGSDVVTDDDIARLKRYEAGPRSRFDALKAIDDSERAADIYGHDDPVYDAQLRAMNAAKRAKIESELTDLGFAPAGTPGRGMMAGSYTIDDLQRALGIGGDREPAKAEIVGNATLETTVRVEPSPDFLAKVDQRVDNKINAFRSSGAGASGSTGSTGRSMPEATAPM
ncbi:hypothetical protein [Bradyrhizobium sp. CCBAU 53340]|uniref:hypothetical protein n=1 Tax=Bradyrhizobium sp. CCBAU 53340 TaxID=1325112 RepID=UPI00188AE00C|nr:hypothetical protein [Bradyrhizobium sp. CCBAU 53340]